jgi:pimeloyl-ACP methyl ester carboxylesterase
MPGTFQKGKTPEYLCDKMVHIMLRKYSIFVKELPLEIAADVREAGSHLLFFVHGLGCSRKTFYHFWNRTDFGSYSVLSPDLAGFGGSAKPEGFSYTMEAQALVCSEILTKLSYRNIHIIAHSMGCAVALLLPDDILNRIKSFTNVEGNLTGTDCGIASRKIISVPQALFESDIFPELRDQFINLEEGYAAIGLTSADALYKSARSLVAWSDSGKLLKLFLELPCRKAYFYGDKNAEHPSLTSVGDIQKVKIRHSGHFPMIDNPEVFYGELYKFITAGTK